MNKGMKKMAMVNQARSTLTSSKLLIWLLVQIETSRLLSSCYCTRSKRLSNQSW